MYVMIRDIRYFVFRVLSSETEEITSDVSNVLHHVNQFTEVRFHEQFNVDLSDEDAAASLQEMLSKLPTSIEPRYVQLYRKWHAERNADQVKTFED